MSSRNAILAGLVVCVVSATCSADAGGPRPYRVVDTGQTHCFSDKGQLTTAPRAGEAFFGQDAFYAGPRPRYRNNGDGTVSDLNTGLMWQKTPDLEHKPTFNEAVAGARKLKLASHGDWRLPTIKELYSLIDFNGDSRARPPAAYIDTAFFDFRFGESERGERQIDAQYWSHTEYVGLTMNGSRTIFGVNFADGRIKGYPRDRARAGRVARFFVRYVRGNKDYGENKFVDNGDGTVSDTATGLMWTRADSGKAVDWRGALELCEGLKLAGHDDWRLPNAKELQSIVDYTRAPDAGVPARRGPAIDPVFRTTDAQSWFWTSTTHLEGPGGWGAGAAYIAFGRATGFMPDRRAGGTRLINVHGAGAQRSDPKSGDPKSSRWVSGLGPQGDVIRIYNYARAVRNIDAGAVKLVKPDTTRLTSSRPPGPGPGQPTQGTQRPNRRPPPRRHGPPGR